MTNKAGRFWLMGRNTESTAKTSLDGAKDTDFWPLVGGSASTEDGSVVEHLLPSDAKVVALVANVTTNTNTAADGELDVRVHDAGGQNTFIQTVTYTTETGVKVSTGAVEVFEGESPLLRVEAGVNFAGDYFVKNWGVIIEVD